MFFVISLQLWLDGQETLYKPHMPWYRRFTLFLILHAIAGILFFSWLCPPFCQIWNTLDEKAFVFLNSFLSGPRIWSFFWSLANHKMMDWLGDCFLFFLLCYYLFQGNEKTRFRRFLFFCVKGCFIAFAIAFINRYFFPQLLQWSRQSPSLVMADFFSPPFELASWNIKTTSTSSFPADHATLIWFVFTSVLLFFRSRPLKWVTFFYAIVFSLPRLIVGAHWLSDIVVGGGAIVCFSSAWFFATPLAQIITQRIFALFCKRREKKCDSC